MIDIVLYEPEIPSNTGNIARTCAATGANLHLIQPLGFDISDKAVKRAGLDYWHLVNLSVYENLDDFFTQHTTEYLWLSTTKGDTVYSDADFSEGAMFLFGKETAGLPDEIRNRFSHRLLRIPMRAEARSLNLSNSVSILCFEALRQQGFPQLLT